MESPPRISVGVALSTCDRPAYLRHLLATLQNDPTSPEIAIYVADNGHASMQDIAAEFGVQYRRIDAPGISVSRNAALDMAVSGGHAYIAFIDDDEWPAPGWLAALLETATRQKAQLVGGPALPDPNATIPQWLHEGDYLAKGPGNYGTYNLLIETAALPPRGEWFSDHCNLVGGEDDEMIRRIRAKGARFVYCEAALVYEHVPPSRLHPSRYVRNGLRQGATAVAAMRFRGVSPLRMWQRILARASRKTAFGLYHLLLIPTGYWHLVQARKDFATARSLILSGLGKRYVFYSRDADH